MKTDVILASSSPRRKELLEEAGIDFRVLVADIDESLEEEGLTDPQEIAKKLAEKKAGAVVQKVLADKDYVGTAVIVGADTLVVLGDEIFGKPQTVSDAMGMLRKFSGNTHQVMTGVSVWCVDVPEPEKVSMGFRTFCEVSNVTFHELTDEQIKDYLKKGESFDKSGSYAAQGEGKVLIDHIDGNVETVVGLPVSRLLQEFPDLFVPKSDLKM